MSRITAQLLGRYPALESDVANDEPELPDAEEGVDESGNQLDAETLPETELMAAADSNAEIENADEEADELVDTAESLESFLMAAQAAKKTGGWSKETAGAIQLGLSASLRKLGLPGSVMLPSVESFGGSDRERINATTSVENAITDALGKIWEAIKRAVNKIITFVRKWYLKVVDGASRLKKRAQAISKKADETTGTAKESKMTISVLSAIRIGKAAPSIAQITTTFDALMKVTKSLTEPRASADYGQSMTDGFEAIENMVETKTLSSSLTAASASLVRINAATQAAIGNTAANKATQGRWAAAPAVVTTHLVATPELCGGKTIESSNLKSDAFAKTESEEMVKAAAYIGVVKVGDFSESKVEIANDATGPVLKANEVNTICDKVIAFCDVVIDYRKGFETYEKANKDVIKQLDKLSSKSLDKIAEVPEVAKAVRNSANTLSAITRNTTTSITQVVTYGLNTSRALLTYGASSLSQYKD